jgi:arsenite methyltransferase
MSKRRNPGVDYGQDVPGMVRDDLALGGILVTQGTVLRLWAARRENPVMRLVAFLGSIMVLVGGLCALEGLAIVWSSRVAKLWERDRLLKGLHLQGNERLLDVGCGHGLLVIGAAKRLPNGRAVGIDLWSTHDQGKNGRDATLANAQIEGVADRVEIHDGDMRHMPFAGASFDAIVASLSVHNVEDQEGRNRAIQEIVRVLKPGGRIAFMDIFHVQQIADGLRQSGMQDVRVSPPRLLHFPPARTVTGRKGQ